MERRHWLSESDYAQLLGLCQFIPGPASSQLGFVFGLLRAGWPGALAAFIGFTLPSALLLIAFAALLPLISGAVGDAAIHGLKLVQLAVVALGGAAGLCWCREVRPINSGGLALRYGPRLGIALLGLFALLLVGLPIITHGSDGLVTVFDAFYRAGALVFGGGHVVLPLLEDAVVGPGWISEDDFLAGYGAAQAVPGPMFTLAAYLGARLSASDGGLIGASAALLAIFLPGLLLVAGVLPLWNTLTRRPAAARAIAGINASVVGLLGAALYDPVWTSAVRDPIDVAVALIGFTLLTAWRVSGLAVVVWCVSASMVVAL